MNPVADMNTGGAGQGSAAGGVRIGLRVGFGAALSVVDFLASDDSAAGVVAAVWLGPSPGTDASAGESLGRAAAFAARAGGPAVVVSPLPILATHPLRFAEDAATCDVVSAGRIELGAAAPSRQSAASCASSALDGSAARELGERLEFLRAAWAGGEVAVPGGRREARVELHPRPARPGGPPLWLEVEDEADAAAAARMGLGCSLAASQASACRLARDYLAGCRSIDAAPGEATARCLAIEARQADAELAAVLSESAEAGAVVCLDLLSDWCDQTDVVRERLERAETAALALSPIRCGGSRG